jgi:chemotaxis protein methyltransferase CheR
LELLKMTEQEFERAARLVYDKSGIHLPPEKLGLVSNRLRRRLRALELNSFADYYQLISSERGGEAELPHFISAVTTNETYFFRNDQLWRFFNGELIPHWQEAKAKTRSLRIWSAASSSGEEAYTAAISLRENIPEIDDWSVTIVASDISPRVLDHARAAIYNDYAISRMGGPQVQAWFDRKDDGYHLKDVVRRMVTFQYHNLRDDSPDGGFDLVFLRNVLMYFDLDMKKRVLSVVSGALAPGGHLIVGDVDPIGASYQLKRAMQLEYRRPGVYQKPYGAGPVHSKESASGAAALECEKHWKRDGRAKNLRRAGHHECNAVSFDSAGSL